MTIRPRLLIVTATLGSVALALQASGQPLPTGVVSIAAGPQGAAYGYLTPQVVSSAGTEVTFVNVDQTSHDVTSRATKTVKVRGKRKQVPLFAAPITNGSGSTSTMPATASLKPGTYDFFCSLHPGMKGTLTVQ